MRLQPYIIKINKFAVLAARRLKNTANYCNMYQGKNIGAILEGKDEKSRRNHGV
jgi:hypothetical protein